MIDKLSLIDLYMTKNHQQVIIYVELMMMQHDHE
jgi:hypothetical protein